jgi:hypothetical protein
VGSVSYQAPNGFPALDEEVASWATPAAAANAWSYVNATLANCHKVPRNGQGTPFTLTIRPMHSPHVGISSAAYEVTGNLSGNAVVYVIDLARKSRAVMSFAYGTYGSLHAAQVAHLLQVAATKLKG